MREDFDYQHRHFESLRIDRSPEDHSAATWVHWGGFLTWVLVPVIILATQHNRRSLAAWHAREAINFQLSLLIYYLPAVPLLLLMIVDPWLVLVSIVFTGVVMAFELIVVILASVAGARGEHYRCPLNIPFVPQPQAFRDSDYYDDRE